MEGAGMDIMIIPLISLSLSPYYKYHYHLIIIINVTSSLGASSPFLLSSSSPRLRRARPVPGPPGTHKALSSYLVFL